VKSLGVYGLSVAVILAMLSPILRRPPVDSFPLSTYPMFASPRTPSSTITTVLGVRASGEGETLSPTLIAGDPWINLAVNSVAAAKRGGASSLRALCRSVAERVAGDPRVAQRYVGIAVVTEVYDAPAYFVGQTTTPRSVELLRQCPLP
jgi:hypothetical protein